MSSQDVPRSDESLSGVPDVVSRVEDLAVMLRRLQRRQARRSHEPALTYRQLAERTGWARSAIGQYLTGKTLPPPDRFSTLIELFGASAEERVSLAAAWDRVADQRRHTLAGRERTSAPASGSRSATGQTPPMAPVPHQLPIQVPSFVGRARELVALNDLSIATPPFPTAVVATVSGTAGIGKTSLVVHWAHQVADRFPDGQLFINLRGFDPNADPISPIEALRSLLHALGVPPEHLGVELDMLTGLYRSTLADRRALVVLDNAASAEQVRPLLPASAGCLALVTSRYELTALTVTDGAHPLRLSMFSKAEARDLLAGRLGADRLTADRVATATAIDVCAGLPLALAIVAGRAAGRGGAADRWSHVFARGTVLDNLDGGDSLTNLRSVFSWSYRRLPPAAARLFALIGLHPGLEISVPAASNLADIDAAPQLAELTRANLLAEHMPGRYTAHDLLRQYATELGGALDPGDRGQARRRLFDYYLRTACVAARIIGPHRDEPVVPPVASGVVTDSVKDYRQAMAWFTAERPVLIAVMRDALSSGFPDHARQLAWSMLLFLHLRGHWHDALATQRMALQTISDTTGHRARAMVYRDLGHAYARLGQYDDAERYLGSAMMEYENHADRDGLAWTEHRLAWTDDQRGHQATAIEHAETALRLFRMTKNVAGEAHALSNIGWYHAQLGDHQTALSYCSRALSSYERLENEAGLANVLDSIGYIHHQLGEHEQAAGYYQRALDLFRQIGETYYQAQVLTHLGDTQQAMGRQDAARVTWHRASTIFDQLRHPNADEVRARLAER